MMKKSGFFHNVQKPVTHFQQASREDARPPDAWLHGSWRASLSRAVSACNLQNVILKPCRLFAAVSFFIAAGAWSDNTAFYSNSENDFFQFPVPGLGLEGPYLEDVNNCGPFLGDITGNGRIDIVVAPWGVTEGHTMPAGRFLDVFYNRNGTFGPGPDHRLVSGLLSCMAGDFTGDGKGDLAVASGPDFMIYLGKVNFSGHISSPDARVSSGGLVDTPYGLSDHGVLELADEGLDISVTRDFLGGARWRRFTVTDSGGEITNGVFPVSDSEQWVFSRMADMDDDGYTDVVIASKQLKGYENGDGIFNADRIKIRIYYGPFKSMTVNPEDAARFAEITLPGTDAVVPLTLNALADMNNDDKPDIVLTSGSDTMIFLQNPDSGFDQSDSPSQIIKNSDMRVFIADINENGFNDLVIGRASEGVISILLNSGDGTFAPDAADPDETIVLPGLHSLDVADMNNNGRQDIVAVAGQNVYVLFNTGGVSGSGQTVFQAPVEPQKGPDPLADNDAVDGVSGESEGVLMMPYYNGTVYPTPQKAEYFDEFIPLDDVGIIIGENIENPGPIVDVLKKRIAVYGGNAVVEPSFSGDRKAWISLGETAVSEKFDDLPAVPDRQESYIVASRKIKGKPVVVLKGRDRLGLLWAVTSFGQLVHQREGDTLARVAEIVDYPASSPRGVLDAGHFNENHTPEKSMLYNVYFRNNSPVYKHAAYNYLVINHPYMSWRDPRNRPPKQAGYIRELGQKLTPLGIKWYGGMHPVKAPMRYKLSGAPEDIEIISNYAKEIADAGGNFYLMFDDHRFFINPFDEKAFGTARRADVHIMNSILEKMNQKYPDAGLMYCPPFYWGPKGGFAKWYGESREDYLRFAGENLAEKIEMNWTGARVKSAGATSEDIEWITELIRRKPAFWQNWAGATLRRVTDPVTVWPEWLHDGFLDEVDGFYLNGGGMLYIVSATIADYCWNPDAYDPERSIREAIEKLAGMDAYEKLKEADDLLSCMDKYRWFLRQSLMNQYKPSYELAKEIERLEADVAAAEQIYKNLFDTSPGARDWLPAGGFWGILRFFRETRADPELRFYIETEAQKRRALEETEYDPEKDVFLAACDFKGAHHDFASAGESDERPASLLSGHRPETAAEFVLAKPPEPGYYTLTISGKTGGAKTDNSALSDSGLDVSEIAAIIAEVEPTDGPEVRIGVKVNDHEIYNGPSPFHKNRWSPHSFEFEHGILSGTNRVSVSLSGVTDSLSPDPLFFVDYGVLRMNDD